MQNNILNFGFHLQTNTLLNPVQMNESWIQNQKQPDVAAGLYIRCVYGAAYSGQ